MASAKHGYPYVADALPREVEAQIAEDQAEREQAGCASRSASTICCRPVVDAFRLTPNIVEVVVRAPLAARHFRPGQFYRLQNYDTPPSGRRVST